MNIKVWLTDLGLDQYAEAFAEHEIDGETLPTLTGDDLKEIGVGPLGHRKKLLAAIANLAADVPSTVEEPAVAPSGERRQVTVLFADLAGYTKLSSELGAEATHALLNRYFEAVDSIVVGYGGHVDKHIGDNVMAVFGAPIAHDDDPLRALRAALDIHERMTNLAAEAGHPFKAHIGIASGQVVASGTGSHAHQEYTVTGDSVNLASRLQDKAKPGETLISDAVHQAAADRIDCESLGNIEVKGLDALVQVWRVVALRASEGVGARVAFVGRRTELAQFSGAVGACRANGTGQAILVRGEAGIGKTRLVEEFAELASDKGFKTHRGLVLDFGVGKGQDAIRSVVRSMLAIAPTGNETGRRSAAETAITRGLLSTDQRVFLNDLLDLPQSLEDRASYDAMDNATRNEGKRTVIANLLRGVSVDAPVVIVVEDVHWADPLTLAHLARISATAADCPVLLVTTSRIEGDPLGPAWRSTTGGCPLMTIDLGPLRENEALKLADGFIDVTNQLASKSIARAEGNPLFLVQLLSNAELHSDESVPASIQSLVLARIDRLSPTDKRAVQAASVIGQRFTIDALRHLINDHDYSCDNLIGFRLVRPIDEGFLFAHALIQEGVYSSLLRATAHTLHRSAADWFAGRDPLLYAEHLERAEDPAAPSAYLDAAQAQAAEYRNETALHLIEGGLALAVDAKDRFALACMQGDILHDLGEMPKAKQAYEAALSVAPTPTDKCRARIGLAAVKRVTEDLDGAFADLERAETVAVEHRLVAEQARIHTLRGNLLFPRGDIEACLREHQLGLDFAQTASSAELEAAALGGVGDAEYVRGHMRTAHARLSRCVELSREHGLGRIEVANLAQVAHTMLYFEPQDVARDAAFRAIEAAQRVGHKRAELNAHMAAIFALFALDERDRCREYIERAQVLVRSLGAWRFEQSCLLYLGRIELAEGQRGAAVKTLHEAVDISCRTGVTFHGPQVYAALARAIDHPDRQRRALAEGEAVILGGCVGHNQLRFYPEAMEVALDLADPDELERYATALEDFTQAEPLPWSDFFIARGRALSALARGERDRATVQELKRLRDEAQHLGLTFALQALNEALVAE